MDSNTEDQKVIEEVLAGQSWRFEVIVKRYEKAVYTSAYAFLRNPQEAEDVAQDVFLSAYQRLSSFQGRSSLLTWLRKITFYRCIDVRKPKRAQPVRSLGENAATLAQDSQVSPHAIAEGKEISQLVRDAIERLGTEHKNVVVLRDLQDLDYAEISEILDIPVGTVRSRLHRARLELRDILSNLGINVPSNPQSNPATSSKPNRLKNRPGEENANHA